MICSHLVYRTFCVFETVGWMTHDTHTHTGLHLLSPNVFFGTDEGTLIEGATS